MKRLFTATAVAAALLACSAQAAEKQRVIIEVQAGKMAAVEKVLAAKGIEPLHRFAEFDALVVSAPSSLLEQLARNPLVRHIEADAPRYPMDQEVPYGIDMVQARDVWDADNDDTVDSGAPTGEGRTVCIIDSGIDADHPDLAGVNLLGGIPEGWDSDTCGHGTHVAGTIAAANNSIGVVGVSPGQVNLYIAKVFDGAECAWSFSSDISAAALQCLRAGADVVNMSLGGGRPTRIENRTFQLLLQRGVLPVASAGNGGNTRYSFPASYPAVMSVAAVDDTMTVADFSQKNDAVEIAAPGVNVRSTVPFASEAAVAVGANVYEALGMDGSPEGVASGPLVDGGLCTAPGAWAGMVVLCERGEITFAEKVAAAEAGGGVGAVIYNNEPGLFAGTLGEDPTSTILSVSVSQEDGQLMLASGLGEVTTVTIETVENTYAYYSGTSMAAPHVSGAAAVLLSSDQSLRGVDVREAMTATALDLGAPGKDVEYGYGLVQMYDAWQYLGGMPNDVRPPLKMQGR